MTVCKLLILRWQTAISDTLLEEQRAETTRRKQQEAEAERKRQAEEQEREVKETLGDEIDAQVGYLGLADVPASAPAGVADNMRASLDRMLGYRIQGLRMFLNRKNGALTIVFDCQFSNGQTTPTQMLVRLFDANGAYLTHFVTADWFVAPNARQDFRFAPSQQVYQLKQEQNSVQYSVNIRDAAYAQKAEFGAYLGH